MQDLLESFYDLLICRGYTALKPTDKESIKIKYPKTEEDYNITLNLGSEFPYNFPEISVTEEFSSRYNIHAHIYNNNKLCLKLDGKESVNPTKPDDILFYAFEKAIKIIDKAISGELNDEKFDELNKYWGLSNVSNKSILAFSFFRYQLNPVGNVGFGYYLIHDSKLYIFEVKDNFYGQDYINEMVLKSNNDVKIMQCMFIEVHDNEDAYRLRNFDNLINYVSKLKNRKVVEYLKSHKETGLITLLVNHSHYKQYSVFYSRDPKKVSKVKPNIAKILPFDSSNYHSVNLIPKMFSQKDLFERSSDGIVYFEHKRLCIIGCGSMGSHLAESYASLGVTEFVLIDNDDFTESNLLRHVCSLTDISKGKAESLRQHLLANYPYLKIRVICKSVFKISADELHESQIDLMIVATADITSEFYCLCEFLQKSITKQVAIFWLEPYAISGHVLMFNRSSWKDNDFDYLLSNIEHISSVKNNADFYKKEVGCNSVFMPYSGFDLRIFISSFLKDTSNIGNDAYTYTKLLNISFARRSKEMIINSLYYKSPDGISIFGKLYD